MKKLISLVLAAVITLSAGLFTVPAYAAEPEAAAAQEDIVTGAPGVPFFDDIFQSIFNFFRMLVRSMYSNTSYYQCSPYSTTDMEVTSFAWHGNLPYLATSETFAFGTVLSFNTDINFWNPASQLAVWYEFSLDDGETWSEIKTSDGTTFLRNRLWQGYLCDASDSSVRFNNMGTNMLLPAESKVSFAVTGDASDRLAGVFYLSEGTPYLVRLQLYACSGSECINYASEPLACVR